MPEELLPRNLKAGNLTLAKEFSERARPVAHLGLAGHLEGLGIEPEKHVVPPTHDINIVSRCIGFDTFGVVAGADCLNGCKLFEVEDGDAAAILVGLEAPSVYQRNRVGSPAGRDSPQDAPRSDVDHGHIVALHICGIGPLPLVIDGDAERMLARRD